MHLPGLKGRVCATCCLEPTSKVETQAAVAAKFEHSIKLNGISISTQNSKVTMNNRFTRKSEQQLLGAFSSALGDADNESTFACGGHIPVILKPSTLSEDSRNDIESRVYDQVIMAKS